MLDNLRCIPEEYRFDYLRSQQRIDEIRKKIKGFEPNSKEQLDWLKRTLKEYHTLFCHIQDIEKKIKLIV